MNRFFVIAACLCYLSAVAQTGQSNIKPNNSDKRHLSFHSINQLGLLEGQVGTSYQMQSVNGFSKDFWFAGVGVGIDHYFQRTVPVFIDIRRSIFNKERSPFIYADAGISFPWEKQKGENVWYKEELKKGSFYDIGLGYHLPVNKSGAFIFSIGYSEKKLQEERYNDYYLIYSGIYEGTSNKNRMDYRFRRISIKAGWQF